ncbi:MAG: V-type ATP synthase subunit F [Candidatus Parvarchaeota archaeon]|nr:V-type ATP synthase subunit F [Candidatus Parvarchaeota archaeon]
MKSSAIAVIGERDYALGFKLLGIKDVFFLTGREAALKLKELVSNSNYELLLVSDDIKDSLDAKTLYHVENSLKPIVLFMPSLKAETKEESLKDLARRVLSVDIWKE